MAPTLSILAPTHNRPAVLARVWPTWLLQEGVTEIVLVNDGSTEDYEPVFRELGSACESAGVALKIIRLPTRLGAPAAKNAGVVHCTAEEVLTTDDDILLPSDLVELCRRSRPKAESPIICGPRVIYLRDGESDSAATLRVDRESLPYFDFKRLTLTPWADPGEVTQYPFITAVALWPRSLFAAGLRYFEQYGGNGYREETDPQLAAQMHFGAKVFLVPIATCFHLPPSVAYATKGGQRRGGHLWFEFWVLRNNARFLARYKSELRSKFGINPWSSWLYLALSRFSPVRLNRFLTKLR